MRDTYPMTAEPAGKKPTVKDMMSETADAMIEVNCILGDLLGAISGKGGWEGPAGKAESMLDEAFGINAMAHSAAEQAKQLRELLF